MLEPELPDCQFGLDFRHPEINFPVESAFSGIGNSEIIRENDSKIAEFVKKVCQISVQ